ncbi:unnamed protein product [Vitrella brassicaformis CCMP3155]|uniref:Uncharacterized protein n=2 Tax=Vitrella brassicaformis TaxID=1169539 RepID=A0A0G4ES72_VITBC|nr:unnamed protein product [Vitrella brassicaformis CCMP3155]|eukprot:CEM00516.1 unnamed protein product [Vitrella brassicaformis CCMP3155]
MAHMQSNQGLPPGMLPGMIPGFSRPPAAPMAPQSQPPPPPNPPPAAPAPAPAYFPTPTPIRPMQYPAVPQAFNPAVMATAPSAFSQPRPPPNAPVVSSQGQGRFPQPRPPSKEQQLEDLQNTLKDARGWLRQVTKVRCCKLRGLCYECMKAKSMPVDDRHYEAIVWAGSAQLCSGCYSKMKKQLKHRPLCQFCRRSFIPLSCYQAESVRGTYQATCNECFAAYRENASEVSKCAFCELEAAFGERMYCAECDRQKSQYGPPRECQWCRKTCAFDKGEPKRAQFGGRLLCYHCSLQYNKIEREIARLEQRYEDHNRRKREARERDEADRARAQEQRRQKEEEERRRVLSQTNISLPEEQYLDARNRGVYEEINPDNRTEAEQVMELGAVLRGEVAVIEAQVDTIDKAYQHKKSEGEKILKEQEKITEGLSMAADRAEQRARDETADRKAQLKEAKQEKANKESEWEGITKDLRAEQQQADRETKSLNQKAQKCAKDRVARESELPDLFVRVKRLFMKEREIHKQLEAGETPISEEGEEEEDDDETADGITLKLAEEFLQEYADEISKLFEREQEEQKAALVQIKPLGPSPSPSHPPSAKHRQRGPRVITTTTTAQQPSGSEVQPPPQKGRKRAAPPPPAPPGPHKPPPEDEPSHPSKKHRSQDSREEAQEEEDGGGKMDVDEEAEEAEEEGEDADAANSGEEKVSKKERKKRRKEEKKARKKAKKEEKKRRKTKKRSSRGKKASDEADEDEQGDESKAAEEGEGEGASSAAAGGSGAGDGDGGGRSKGSNEGPGEESEDSDAPLKPIKKKGRLKKRPEEAA